MSEQEQKPETAAMADDVNSDDDDKEVSDYDDEDVVQSDAAVAAARFRKARVFVARLALIAVLALLVGEFIPAESRSGGESTATNVDLSSQSKSLQVEHRRTTTSSTNTTTTKSISYPDARKQVTFYVTGDAPYDKYQAAQLETYMERIPSDAEFVAHVGDMRWAGGGDVCLRREYQEVAYIMKKSHAPVFMLVGDNDIHDCPNESQAWRYWRRSLDMLWEQWNTGFHTKQRIERLPGIAGTGTWSFVLDNVLFLGVHLTDSYSPFVRNQTIWALDLIRKYNQDMKPYTGRIVLFGHAGPEESSENEFFFNYLSKNLDFEGAPPLVYIQGDWHYWEVEQRFFGQPNWMRIVVAGESEEAPTRISVTSTGYYQDARDAFRYQRRS